MKKVFSLLVLAALSVGAAGCGGASKAEVPATVAPPIGPPQPRVTGPKAAKAVVGAPPAKPVSRMEL